MRGDLLLDLGQRPAARSFLRALGLPTLAEPLKRAKGPWVDEPLGGHEISLGEASGATLRPRIGHVLKAAGAIVSARSQGPFDAIVFDATGLRKVCDLSVVYTFFHERIAELSPSGRVVVFGRSEPDSADFEACATQRALDGFVRSLAKEIGRRGATAQFVSVDEGADERIDGLLRFLLSDRSVFVSGQPFVVTHEVAKPQSVPWTRPLQGKVALVTGAARGIGEATARLLAGEGAEVVCLDRPEDGAAVRALASAIGGRALLADVSQLGAPRAIADSLMARGVDVVVHNAGVTRDKTIARMSREQWDQALGINLEAVVDITRALLHGPLRDQGRIVCLSSVAGIAGNMGQTNYAASKAGVIGMVKGLAKSLAPRGIAVNAVAPGFIETRLTAAVPLLIRQAGRRLSSLGQGGLPEDVAQVITFLASPGAYGLSGQTIRVCGGALIGA